MWELKSYLRFHLNSLQTPNYKGEKTLLPDNPVLMVWKSTILSYTDLWISFL